MSWKNIIQGFRVVGESEATKTLYVDANRTDDYIENGCIVKPFKTIQAAIAVASYPTLLVVAPGTYNGDIVLNGAICGLRGSGKDSTYLTGNITAGESIEQSISNFRINSSGSLAIVGNANASNLRLYCAVTVSGTGSFNGEEVVISPIEGIIPLTMSGTKGCSLHRGWIEATGNASAIIQTNGTLSLIHFTAENTSAGNTTIESSGGVSQIRDTIVINNGGGNAISLDNDGSTSVPNALNFVVAAGNISCAAIPTLVEGLNFIIFGALAGTNLIYKPASRINNDSTIVGDTVKDALETLNTQDGSYIPLTQKGAANGVAELDGDSKVPTGQLPALAITDTHIAANEVTQLALTVQKGDVCVRSDQNKSYIALNSDNVDMGDWQELLTPTDLVLSVNGEVGAVSLDLDEINEGTTYKRVTATKEAQIHVQGTDQKLDEGGVNEVAVADAKDAVTKKHSQNTDTHLGTVDQDIPLNTHKLTGLSVPNGTGQSIRSTTKITEANVEDAIDKKHIQNPKEISFFLPGDAYVNTNLGGILVGENLDNETISKVKIHSVTAPTGASLIVDININDVSIFTTQNKRPEIAIGGHADDSDTPDITSLSAGNLLTFAIDQIGSTISGTDIYVTIVMAV